MTNFRWGTTAAPNFESLIRVIPSAVLDSPRRSVVPLVDYFRQPAAALDALGRATRIDLQDPIELAFEHPVAPPAGRGKASYTDLMVRCADVTVAIEAKFAEPRYETVRQWLGPSPTSNRTDVLTGWLSLIAPFAAARLEVESILDLPYQLVHRTASACSTASAHRAMVYLIFGDGPHEHYVNDIAALERLLGEPAGLAMHVVEVPLDGEPAFTELTRRWDGGERKLASSVREALLDGPLFRFGELRPLRRRAA